MTTQTLLLGTYPDAQPLFAHMANRDHAIWLDSSSAASERGRFHILGCDPAITLTTRGDITEICSENDSTRSTEDPLKLLQQTLQRRAQLGDAHPEADLPIHGGALGYFSYELGNRFEPLPEPVRSDNPLPEMCVGLYDWLVIFDKQTREATLVYDDARVSNPTLIEQWIKKFTSDCAPESKSFRVLAEPVPDSSFDDYAMAFDKVMDYLREGDCYQINLAQRFRASCEGDPWELYQALRQINPAPFSAYLNTPAAQILCASPERFIQLREGVVETRPIKGTRPRSKQAEEDQRLASELQQSEKDRAENVMIVDLLRNDLGRSCDIGSIDVPELFAIETFATVHHLVSTVTGRLSGETDALDLLRGSFPGGSITGAPKVRAMEVIHELEQKRRDIYCGSIGYIGYNGNMDTNIVIRSLLHRKGELTFWAGGGLVIDSTLESEYQETLDKAYSLQLAIQSERWN